MSGPLKLASPTFLAGPNDALAAVDVFSRQANGAVINSIQNVTDKATIKGLPSLRGGYYPQPILTGMLDGKLKIDKDALTNRLIAATGAPGVVRGLSDSVNGHVGNALGMANGTINGMPGQLDSAIGSGLNNLKGAVSGATGLRDKVSAEICGHFQEVEGQIVGSLKDLAKAINELMGGVHFKMVDLSALSAIYQGIMKDLKSIGFKNPFKGVMHCMTDPALKKAIAKRAMDDAIETGDIDMLGSISDELGFGAVGMLRPEAIEYACVNYSTALGSTSYDVNAEYTNMMTSFNSVDNEWMRTTRQRSLGPETIVDLTAIQAGSEDFRTTMALGAQNSVDPEEKLLTLVNVFPPTSVEAELQNQFPLASFDPKTRNRPPTIDPRTMSQSTSWEDDVVITAHSTYLGPSVVNPDKVVMDQAIARLGWDPRDGGNKTVTAVWMDGKITGIEHAAFIRNL